MFEPPALRLAGVTRQYGGLVALEDFSLDLPVGARHGIIGPNGAGKTTLFQTVSGELPPTRGRIELFGVDVTRARPQRRVALGLGRTYQITRTFPTLTVRENLVLGVHGRRSSRFWTPRGWRANREVAASVLDIAARVGLDHRLDALAGELSYGQVRRLDVALALALAPRLLLLDEPGAGLSPDERTRMIELLRSLPAALTVVLIEHDMDLVRDVVQTVSVLHNGRLVAETSSVELHLDERVREIYLGAGAA
jgi:branched-chain amino acid transport system ATP-binding protein